MVNYFGLWITPVHEGVLGTTERKFMLRVAIRLNPSADAICRKTSVLRHSMCYRQIVSK